MASITVKNIPDDLYERLKTTASVHHRSINSEVISCLENALKPKAITTEERLDRIRSIRKRVDPKGLDASDISGAIQKGRP